MVIETSLAWFLLLVFFSMMMFIIKFNKSSKLKRKNITDRILNIKYSCKDLYLKYSQTKPLGFILVHRNYDFNVDCYTIVCKQDIMESIIKDTRNVFYNIIKSDITKEFFKWFDKYVYIGSTDSIECSKNPGIIEMIDRLEKTGFYKVHVLV